MLSYKSHQTVICFSLNFTKQKNMESEHIISESVAFQTGSAVTKQVEIMLWNARISDIYIIIKAIFYKLVVSSVVMSIQ